MMALTVVFVVLLVVVCVLAMPTVLQYAKHLSNLRIQDPFRRKVVTRLSYEANVSRILEEINRSRLEFVESRRALYSLNTLDKPSFSLSSPGTGSMRCFPYATYHVRVLKTPDGSSEVTVWESVPKGTIALLLGGAIGGFPWTLPLSAAGILIAMRYDFSAIPALTLHRLNLVSESMHDQGARASMALAQQD